ncbi:phosphopantothenoylcysteine decarboxylase/phosphopantothenate--cysteine ligase [Cryobacterium mesophilum]|uniref:Coenzyme A biosynthesis bifunctional protein CoaBC n=1 Tax=Terrimesophilobacter mesophilus TaxID=433647 RepID=A0A4R8V913_9MICO|nr:bifunctional phosphopantothenoylcysteine decarboxylase/phosphopantothenate--cysteine ligase CoaBC [Terrimesophilobacter mesophilus]MBB5631886.1 phosphopantothenoylcysteine decarboxylase/phosphopantothenate--cysteine ligase [Terrimesophilobacter mesophilus]TFB78796.1 bifunctional phosphopantothenoylcysteine decarboxylase/phosphopantothenate--cysteine ligase CoaBC [Terrimesophilobacter mesophilus]
MNVVVGVAGGIAAYKAVGVIRALVLAGHDVHVVATESALKFVGLPTLEAISRNPVHHELFEGVAQVRHVAIGQAADVIVVAPATANIVARLAAGLADDLLGTTILASTAPLVIAPAMHTEMWQNPATVQNVATLRSRGVTIVGPGVGQLTGSDSGAGRMAEPEEIVARVLSAVVQKDYTGRRVLVTAGGTREPIDPVRFIGNRSSGKQGVAIAAAAAARGAHVTLIGANLEVPVAASMEVLRVGSAQELAEATLRAAKDADLVIMAAAVADYRPATVVEEKIAKESQGDRLTLELVRNPDILATLGERRADSQVIVGFAAETEPDDERLRERARAKLARKGCDFLVVNRVGWSEGFGTDDNTVAMLDKGGDIVLETSGTKSSVADRILDILQFQNST